MTALSLDKHEVESLQQFYRDRDNRCAWSAAQVTTLRAALGRAGDQGLDVARYHLEAIQDALLPATRDVYASAMALRYGHDMLFGSIDLAKVEIDIDVPRPTDDLTHQLDQALAKPDIAPWLVGLTPTDPAYLRLVDAYRYYRGRIAVDDESPIAGGRALRLGDSDVRVIALKERLRNLGDLHVVTEGPKFDATVKEALIAFQHRHGLNEDGRLDRETLAALNVPDRTRLRQLALNLQRWRYFGHVLAATRVEVNITAETARLIEKNKTVLAMRAVVGGRKHQSPVLVSTGFDAIIVNPPWYVPESIIEKEIKPRLETDPDYIARHDMHWDDGHLKQSPGPGNALGRIKFDFPNRFSVYLHDTPERNLFARLDRARSHGCVRLEKPTDLALRLLAGRDDWPAEKLKAALEAKATQKIELTDGPQVAVVYWTAFVDEDGTVEFRNDLYGRDARLEAAIDHPNQPPRQRPAGMVSAQSW